MHVSPPSQTVLLWANGPRHKQQIYEAMNVWVYSDIYTLH